MMHPPTRADLQRLVTATVCGHLHLDAGALDPATDLRELRAFSSFAAVTILERLEEDLGVEVPAERLTADRLCSVAALTDLFAQSLSERRAVSSP
ncbi:acyl carrier protein [Spirillospora sp. NPDC127200]